MIRLVRMAAAHRRLLFLVLAALACAVGLVAYYFHTPSYPEVRELASVSWTQVQYQNYFVDLARAKGGDYAFQVLHRASFPIGTEIHTIGHYIGYVLHDQLGAKAITICTHYEMEKDDSCMHGVVIQEFVKEGQGAVQRLVQACESMGRGTSSYAYCYHGVGHGLVAMLSYDLEASVKECKEVAKEATNADPETDHQGKYVWKECVDGASMEATQGTHDPIAWARSKETYMPESDILMPCDASFMPSQVSTACYNYIRGRMLNAAGIHRGDTTFDHAAYAKALAYCELVPDPDNRNACYGGFGIYFVFLGNGQDDRSFNIATDAEMRRIHELCMLGDGLAAQSPCTLTASEVFLGKSTSVDGALRFCQLTPDPTLKDRCYHTVITLAKMYVSPLEVGLMYFKVPSQYGNLCLQEMNAALKLKAPV